MNSVPERGDVERHEAAFIKLFGGNLLVTLANLLRDVAIAVAFGASVATDNFFLAISIPIFLLTVASGAWRSVVVPLLARIARQQQASFTAIARRLTGASTAGVTLVALALALLSVAFYLFVPAGPAPQGVISVTGFATLVLPMYCLAAFTELGQGPLQARHRLFVPNLARAVMPVGLILSAWLVGDRLGVLALVPGGTLGALAGAAIIAVLMAREGILPGLTTKPLPAADRSTLVGNFWALVTATSITYLSPLIGQWMAGGLGPGAVSYLGYANRLTTGAISLVTGSLAPVLLGFYATRVASGGISAVRSAFITMSCAFSWVGCAMSLGTWLSSDYLVDLVYQHGEFTQQDAESVRLLVDCYALGFPMILVAVASNTLISALSRNAVFIPIGVALLLSTVIANFLLMQWLGVAGIALASSLVYGVSLVLLNGYLQRGGGLGVSVGEWLQIATPFGVLAIAGLAPLWWSVRIDAELQSADVLAAILVLTAFLAIAVFANREFLRSYLTAWRARRPPAQG